MFCNKCNHKFDCAEFLPLIDKQGETQCQKCFTMMDSQQMPMVNKQLVKLMGRCPKHIQCQLTLLNLTDKKCYCPKCIIFTEDKSKYEKFEFIQIDGGKNSVDNIIKNNQIILEGKKEENNNKIINRVDLIKKQAIHQLKRKISDQYNRIVEELQNRRIKQEKEIVDVLQNIGKQFWEEWIAQYTKLQDSYQKLNLEKMTVLKPQQKYDRIAELIQLNKNMRCIQKSLQFQGQIVVGKFKNYEKQYKCLFGCQFSEKNSKAKQETKQRNKIIDEQILISDIVFPQKLTKQIVFEKIQEIQEFSTQNNSVAHETSFVESNFSKSQNKILYDSLSTSRTIASRKSTNIGQKIVNSKSTLVLNNLEQANKIGTQVKEVSAVNLNLNNTDGKKILDKLSKSFVKYLDLSNNKLTDIFLKDLNKTQIGKYLKSIKLSGNHIDSRDSAVGKKIEQLKNQGVNIII